MATRMESRKRGESNKQKVQGLSLASPLPLSIRETAKRTLPVESESQRSAPSFHAFAEFLGFLPNQAGDAVFGHVHVSYVGME